METIDVKAALAQLGGSEKLYKTVVTGFYDKYMTVDHEIETLLEEGAIEDAARLAHSIKGLAGNLGSEGLRQCALGLELAIKGQDPLEIASRVKDFSNELQSVNLEISRLMVERFGVEPEGTPTIHHGQQIVGEAMTDLFTALQTYRYAEVRKELEKFKAITFPVALEKDLNQVVEYVEAYDYDLAIEAIRKLKMA